MQHSEKSLAREKHEWGWALLVGSIIVVNLGAHVVHEIRSCKGAVSALGLCKADAAQVQNRVR
jgi:hypothetical protein